MILLQALEDDPIAARLPGGIPEAGFLEERDVGVGFAVILGRLDAAGRV